MTAKLDSIIRYQKWELDNKRRDLAEVEEQREQIVGQMNGLQAEFEQEKASAGGEASILMMGAYAQGVKVRQEALEQQLADKDAELDKMRDEVTEAFQELKTYEVAQENRVQAEKKEELRQEGMAFDEQGLQSFVRKRNA